MRRTSIISLFGLAALLGCHHSSPPPPQAAPSSLHEVRDQQGNVIERDILADNESPPPPITEAPPPQPYPTALWIRGYWYEDRPHRRWIWIQGHWR